jgi:hypothetical protein
MAIGISWRRGPDPECLDIARQLNTVGMVSWQDASE